MRTRLSWRRKLEKIQEPRLVRVNADRAASRLGTGLMLIPKPLDVDALIRTVPAGEVITVRNIREALARRFGADFTCPLTTGIFIRIAAEAAEEARRAGEAHVTPWWRVVKDDGTFNPKFPGGVEEQAQRLALEGHVIERVPGRRPRLAFAAADGRR